MLPLKIFRVSEYRGMYQPSSQQRYEPAPSAAVDETAPESVEQAAARQDLAHEDRRNQTDRRSDDRREKQQATFLNTRKIQGRRRSDGRRNTDSKLTYTPISLKG
jgi:hypothetical protein